MGESRIVYCKLYSRHGDSLVDRDHKFYGASSRRIFHCVQTANRLQLQSYRSAAALHSIQAPFDYKVIAISITGNPLLLGTKRKTDLSLCTEQPGHQHDNPSVLMQSNRRQCDCFYILPLCSRTPHFSQTPIINSSLSHCKK